MLYVVSSMEKSGKRSGYIASVMKPLKNWFAWNDIQVTQKIKISGGVNHPRSPTKDPLRLMS